MTTVVQIGAAAIGVGLLWTFVIRRLFPAVLPGEVNTALLATVRPVSSTPVTAKDLENVTEYDYIIVGTGTAGCVLANRLSADPNTKVLAIEAGHSDLKQLMSRIPAGLSKLFRTPADWNFATTSQSECDGRKLDWPRGKMIGGCSSINAMIYTKGAPDDYDEWERLGNAGWSYNDVKSYMTKAERFRQPDDPQRQIPAEDLAQHGQTGLWDVGYNDAAEISHVFMDACDSVGVTKTQDINTDRGILGATSIQTFINAKGERSSTAVAYLTPDVVRRPNLKIASGQTVTRIIFDTSGSQPRAVGIEMASSKLTPLRYLAKARKEVLLCGGSVGTPQLLKISGVGPAKELQDHSIPLVKELTGVGENLMDHIAFNSIVFKTDRNASYHYLQDPIKSLPATIQWLRSGTGPMTSQACNSFAFVRSADRDDAPEHLRANDHSSGPTSADIELITMSLCFTDQGRFIAPQQDGYNTLFVVSLRPEARGAITLASSDPFAAPLIDPRILSNEYDMDLLLYGVRLALKIAKSEPYKKYFKGWYIGPFHPLDWDNASDDEIKAQIRKDCQTLYHPMGTAKMGKGADAVVDDQLRVHGVQGLRVVDASIFPTPLACHTCAPVVMVAEKAADMIKNPQV